MKYVGSKNRLSKDLVPIIQSYIDNNNIKNYLEPFVGGANLIDKIRCANRYGSDIHKYLIALLQHVQITTDDLPATFDKNEYKAVRQNPNKYPEWYVGLVGFCGSYNAKWFGGYANNVKTKNGTIRNYTDESIRNLIKQAPSLKGIEFFHDDYINCGTGIRDYVVYCDIPYRNSTKYATKNFDYEEFYDWCKYMGQHNIVLISEYWMPDDFDCIWQKQLKCTLDKNSRSNKTEKLFIYRGDYAVSRR